MMRLKFWLLPEAEQVAPEQLLGVMVAEEALAGLFQQS
jgi:hypothetical protein